jgi:hypothetical protein
MSRPILFRVLAKRRLRPLPPSMSTRVSYEPAMTGSRTSGSFAGLEKLLHGMLYRANFMQGQLLRMLGGEAIVSIEDDVGKILRVQEILSPRLVTLVIILLVLSLSGLGKGWSVE